MQVRQDANPSKDVFKVSQWKWEPDAGEPWWRRVFFHYVYLPFQNFSFGVMKVPNVKEVIVESDEQGNVRRTFRWFEDEGTFEDEERADAACLGEHWGYKKQPFNRLMPSDSAQYQGTVFPRKKNPRRWAKPTLSLVIKDRAEDEHQKSQLAAYLTQINQVLDR